MWFIQLWQNHRLIDEYDYDPELNQQETIEKFINDMDGLDVGEGFTYIIHRTA